MVEFNLSQDVNPALHEPLALAALRLSCPCCSPVRSAAPSGICRVKAPLEGAPMGTKTQLLGEGLELPWAIFHVAVIFPLFSLGRTIRVFPLSPPCGP